MNKKYIIPIIMVLLVFVAYFLIDKNLKRNQVVKESSQLTSTSTELQKATSSNAIDVTASGKGDFKVEKINNPTDIKQSIPKPLPDLSRKIQFSSTLNTETKNLIEIKINELKDFVKSNPLSLSSWIDLGNYHKMAGDFNGAVIYWNYASLVGPDSFIPFSNLADLYGYYIKDVLSAEKNYNLSISKAPDQSFVYFKFAEFYRDVLGDKAKSLSVVESGLKALPNNTELKALEASLK